MIFFTRGWYLMLHWLFTCQSVFNSDEAQIKLYIFWRYLHYFDHNHKMNFNYLHIYLQVHYMYNNMASRTLQLESLVSVCIRKLKQKQMKTLMSTFEKFKSLCVIIHPPPCGFFLGGGYYTRGIQYFLLLIWTSRSEWCKCTFSCTQITFFQSGSNFLRLWALLLCPDNPSTWQFWYIKMLVKQYKRTGYNKPVYTVATKNQCLPFVYFFKWL